MTKQCSKCKIIKDINEFYKSKSRKDGIRDQCKSCEKEYSRQYNILNKDILKSKRIIYLKENKEKVAKTLKKYKDKNKEKISKQSKIYKKNNREKIAIKAKPYQKEYYKTHIEAIKAYNKTNKELIKERSKQYQKDNRGSIALKAKIYRKDNKEEIVIWRKKYLDNNKERQSRVHREYCKKNREKIAKQSYQHRKERRENDPNFSLVERLRNNTRRYFNNDTVKTHTTKYLIGTDWETAIDYLKNLGYDQALHDLDHIVPLSAFNVQDRNHQRIMFNYMNIQPLTSKENNIKRASLLPNWKETIINITNQINIDPFPIIEYIKSQNIEILHKDKTV